MNKNNNAALVVHKNGNGTELVYQKMMVKTWGTGRSFTRHTRTKLRKTPQTQIVGFDRSYGYKPDELPVSNENVRKVLDYHHLTLKQKRYR